MTNRVNYFKRGKELFETFCTQVNEFSRMFPTCPAHQEYIDIHRKSDVESEKQKLTAGSDTKKNRKTTKQK